MKTIRITNYIGISRCFLQGKMVGAELSTVPFEAGTTLLHTP